VALSVHASATHFGALRGERCSMRKRILLVVACVMLVLSSGRAFADVDGALSLFAAGNEVVYSAGEGSTGPLTVTSRFVLKGSALGDCESLLLAGLAGDAPDGSESLAFRWVNKGFVWRLQLASANGILPEGLAPKTDETGLAYMEFDLAHVAQAVPRIGHSYEAVLSFNPADGMISVRLVDTTEDLEVYSTYFAANSASGYFFPVTGAVRSEGASTDMIDVVSLTESASYAKLGLPLDLKRGLQWSLVERVNPGSRISYPLSPRPAKNPEYSYFENRDLGVYLRLPDAQLDGQLQLLLVADGVERLLYTFAVEPAAQMAVLLQEEFPPGDSTLVLRYVDAEHTVVYGQLPVRLTVGTLVCQVAVEDRRATTGRLSGLVTYRFDADMTKIQADSELLDSFGSSILTLRLSYSSGDSVLEQEILSKTLNALESRQGEFSFDFDATAVEGDVEVIPEFVLPKGLNQTVTIQVAEVSPAVFWASEPLGPGEMGMLRGDNFAEIGVPDRIELVRLDDGNPGDPQFILQSDPLGTGVDEAALSRMVSFTWPETVIAVDPIQPTEQSVKFILPEDLDWGLYVVRMRGQDGAVSPDVLINEPKLWWSQGDQGMAASPGGWMRLFGNNLATTAKETIVRFEPVDSVGTLFELDAEIVDEASLKLAIPSDFAAGEYLAYVHNGCGGQLGWSMPMKVTISEADEQIAAVFNVKDFGAVGNGKQDDGDAIRAALKAAQESGGGTVYLPRGAYRVSGTFSIPRRTSLKGEARESVALFWNDFDDGTEPPLTLIEGVGQFSIENLTIYCVRYENVIAGTMGNITISNVTIRAEVMKGLLNAQQQASRLTETRDYVLRFSGNNIKILNTDLHSSGYGVALRDVSNVIVADSILNGGAHISNAKHVVFEDNVVPGWCVAAQWGISGFYLSRNTFEGIYEQHREAMTTDGGGGSTHRTVLGAGADWVMVEGSAALTQMPSALILSGKGAGQVRTVARYNEGRYIMDEPWDVQPDASSVISFTALRNRMIFMDNQMIDTGHFQFYGTAIEAIVKRNTTARSGGFWLRGQDTGGVCIQPAWYIQYLENRIAEGFYYHWDGDDQWSGPAMLGAMVRITPANGDVLAVIGAVFRGNAVDNNGIIRTSTGTHRTPVIEDVIIELNDLRDTAVGIDLSGAIARVVVRANTFEGVDREISRPVNVSNQQDVMVLQ